MNKQEDSESARDRTETPGCCGGAPPEGSDACCKRDAEAKAEGRAGCGCSPPATAAAKGSCCA